MMINVHGDNGMMRMSVAALLVAGLITGCGTAPKRYDVERSRVVNQSYETVWSGLISYLAERNIPLKSFAKDSGVIFAEAVTFDEGQADCGSPGLLKPIARYASINILVRPQGSAQKVTVNSRFVETRFNSFDYSSTRVECNSKGVVEERILSALGPGAPTPAKWQAVPTREPSAAPASSQGASKEQQLQELQNTPGLSYEEYQRRYQLIMGQ